MKDFSISNLAEIRQEILNLLPESNYNQYKTNQYILIKTKNIEVHEHRLRGSQINTCRENDETCRRIFATFRCEPAERDEAAKSLVCVNNPTFPLLLREWCTIQWLSVERTVIMTRL
jgi:hypothetical protein